MTAEGKRGRRGTEYNNNVDRSRAKTTLTVLERKSPYRSAVGVSDRFRGHGAVRLGFMCNPRREKASRNASAGDTKPTRTKEI